jgi:glycosyltransferase involved in cell wall biosynthesis
LAEARKNGLEACLIIAGVIDRSARAAAEAIAEAVDVGPQVTFSGPYAQAAAPALFGAADAFLLTTHNDACPTAVIEAMACGLPVVYARSGGVPELVGGEAGIGVETGDAWDGPRSPDPSQLGAAMIEAAGRRAALASAARSRAVERFDIGAWYARQRQVFQALLEARRG